jgi:hypothetical protein
MKFSGLIDKKNRGKKKQIRIVNFIIPNIYYLGYKCKWALLGRKFKKRNSRHSVGSLRPDMKIEKFDMKTNF